MHVEVQSAALDALGPVLLQARTWLAQPRPSLMTGQAILTPETPLLDLAAHVAVVVSTVLVRRTAALALRLTRLTRLPPLPCTARVAEGVYPVAVSSAAVLAYALAGCTGAGRPHLGHPVCLRKRIILIT